DSTHQPRAQNRICTSQFAGRATRTLGRRRTHDRFRSRGATTHAQGARCGSGNHLTFIVFDGGEGSGKSTQATRIAQWLRDRGLEVVLTFEPGDTKMGAQMRDVLLHGDAPLDARSELMLMLAD